ncbi:MAG: adenine nucleotide alpha hydrolase [Alphaproteobacteria bacterium]|nr:adenine nucleotide alpha hydrolase [Alphaproteobacteria bacterium]
MSEPETSVASARVAAILSGLGRAAIAVSGGVDSLTLATIAQRTLGAQASMLHAVSPAVPPDATRRVRDEAARQGWRLDVIDAGEFADPAYRANPSNRCFYCKTNLYGAIAARTREPIVSGTNLDDLDDVRPGLEAAKTHGVRHPFVEAGVTKDEVRRIARNLGLREIALLPASPCLSSRVETGLWIEPAWLALIHEVETLVANRTRATTVRCRVRAQALVIELDEPALSELNETERHRLHQAISDRLTALSSPRPITFTAYRRGSAFLDGRARTAP